MTTPSSTTHRLTDTQLVLLSQAAQHAEGKVVPPANLRGGAVQRVVAALALKGLIAASTGDDECGASYEVEARQPDFVITSAGLAAIGLAPDGEVGDALSADREGLRATGPARAIDMGLATESVEDRGLEASKDAPLAAPRDGSKQAQVLAMLSRPSGASIDELTGTTGWQPHTTRAVLSGLRKRGHMIERSSGADGASQYRIVAGGTKTTAANAMSVDPDVLSGTDASSATTPAS
jgi:hypothetical protein